MPDTTSDRPAAPSGRPAAPSGRPVGPRPFTPPGWANPVPATAPDGLAVLIGPPRPPLLDRYWPGPARPPSVAVLAGALGTGLLAALTLWTERLGLQSGLLAVALTSVAVLAARRPAGGDPRPASWSRRAFTVLAVGLAWVPAVRDAAPGMVLSVLGALGLAALAAADGRSWPAVLGAWPAAAVGAVRSLFWAAGRATRFSRPAALTAWLRGAVVSVAAGWLMLALLRSADAAFDAAVDAALPDIRLASLPGRVVLLALFAVAALALAFLVAAPPRWDAVRLPHRAGGRAEWALPLALVDLLLAFFVAVQAALLFGRYPAALVTGGLTPAERARQGFGQLVAVTLLAVVLLAWAGRRCGGRSAARWLLAGLGGGLVVLVLVVVASALRRMALYEAAFGWTVLRLHVAAFEVWLAVVLVLCAVAWAVRRTDLVARGVVLAAGTGLLALCLASPDAVAAAANVARFEGTGKIDTWYLSQLSDDAVPALLRLEGTTRERALAGRVPRRDPWYAVNLSRLRAAAVLDQ